MLASGRGLPPMYQPLGGVLKLGVCWGFVHGVKSMMSAHAILLGVQMTGYCTTWSGEGDAAAGTRQVATEIDFHTDIDEDGVELVSLNTPHHLAASQDLHCCQFKKGQFSGAVRGYSGASERVFSSLAVRKKGLRSSGRACCWVATSQGQSLQLYSGLNGHSSLQ